MGNFLEGMSVQVELWVLSFSGLYLAFMENADFSACVL